MTAPPAAPSTAGAVRSRPHPLGVHLDASGTGADAAVHAPHADAVEVALLDDDGRGGLVERRVALTGRTHGVWHGRLEGVGAGQRYGLRVSGPWEPERGHRFNPAKLLLDPYARAVADEVRWDPSLFGHVVDDEWRPVDGPVRAGGARLRSTSDSAAAAAHGVLLPARSADPRSRPRVPWADTVVYEAHVRGLTALHPDVPPEVRGTYAALGHPAVVDHLRSLGVTALELLPVFAVADEAALVRRGRTNAWGYSTLSYFAPAPRYASAAARAAGPAAVVDELAGAVDALHAGGLEVLLDVVYNHTAEGGVGGPSLSLRGVDAAAHYRLDDHGQDVDVTGCGGTLDFSSARVVQLALDSLRHWVTSYGVDGFRFDLAPALARDRHLGYDPDHPFLVALRTDPVLADVKLVAEPWDVGPDGWRTGQFPAPFAEWNDRFRDDVRSFWLADAARARRGEPAGDGVRHLATRLTGSADLFSGGHGPSTGRSADADRRGPLASVSFLAAHDGFTLADATAYDHKHNEGNGESNRDGHGDNRSANHGVEGPTDDPAVLAARRRSVRNLLGTLAVSAGVPMLLAGDEMLRTQHGNNNAYVVDDETGWLDWPALAAEAGSGPRSDLLATTRALLALRREHPVLRQADFLDGRPVHADGTADVAWSTPSGTPMAAEHWHDTSLRTLQVLLHPRPPSGDAAGADVGGGQSLLLVLHAGAGAAQVRLPGHPEASSHVLLWDSAVEHPDDVPRRGPGSRVGSRPGSRVGSRPGSRVGPGDVVDLGPTSMRIYAVERAGS